MVSYNVTITGTSPLLQNQFPVEEFSNESKPPGQKTDRVKQDASCKRALYKTSHGVIYQPAEHIRCSLINAAKEIKSKGNTMFTKYFQSGYLAISPQCIPHKYPDWEMDLRAVVPPNAKNARVIRARPRFDKWELDFVVEVDEAIISLEVLKKAFDIAGILCGIGDWRPQKKGPMGRFIYTKIEEITQ